MPNFEIKDKNYATSLQTGDLFLVQTDLDGARTNKKYNWGRLSGEFNNQINATGASLQTQISNIVTGTGLLASKYLGSPTDGSYGGTNGAIAGVTVGDIHEDAFDKIETILGKLAPAKPLNLSATTLTLLNTSYSAIEQGTSTTRTNVISSYFPTGQATGFYDGDAGILSGLVNSVATGVKVLSTGNDIGIYTGLNIIADYDYYSGQAGKANFWTYLSSNVSPSGGGLNSGQFTLQLKHSTTGPTNILTGYCDAPITPTLGIISVLTGTSTTTIIDGIPSLATNDQISVACQLTGAVSSYYRSPISQISSSNTSTTTVNTTGTPLSGAVLILSGIVTVSVSKYITGFIPTVVGYNSAGTSSSNTTYNSNIRIDTVSTQPSQRRTSSTGLYPQLGQFGATYSNNSLLTGAANEELQLANGIIQYPFLVNYAGVVPTGPNYLNMPSGSYGNAGTGYRWACFNMGTVNDVSSLTLTYNTTTNFGSSVINGGMMLQVRVSGATPTNGWLDGNGAFPGVGNPTNDGDLALTVGSSTSTVKLISFGSAVKNGSVFARVGIPSGSNKSFASLTMS